MEIIKTVLCSLLSVATLFLITKIMGHKQVAQLDFFDYVSGITIGSVGAELATNLEEPWKPLTALFIYGAVSVILNILTRKLQRTRKYINGTPTILMSGGRLYRENLKAAKLDLSEFMLLCRELGYFDLEDIQLAVFEHNGRLSVLPSEKSRPLTPNDLQITTMGRGIGTEIIMDGRIMEENLTRLGRDLSWLLKRLGEQNIKDAREVFLGVYYAEEDRLALYPYK